ncbi:MAG: FliH/SctL family protein [Bacilli bacterium]
MSKIWRSVTTHIPDRQLSFTAVQSWERPSPLADVGGSGAAVQGNILELEREISLKKAILEAVREESLRVVETAQRHAEQLLEQARQESVRLTEEAAAAGRREGFQVGVEAARQECDGQVQFANRVAKQAELDRQERIRTAEEAIAELALQVAGRIVERALDNDGDYLVRIVQSVLSEVERAPKVELLVAAVDYGNAVSRRAEFERALAPQTQLVIAPDHTLLQGDVMIVSEYGTLDGRVATRLEEAGRTLRDIVKEWMASAHD